MPDAPAEPTAPADQPTLLTTASLRLSSELRVAEIRPDRIVVKYQPGRRYLIVTTRQWHALELFGTGRSVPDVLFTLLSDRRCPPLREYYELVLKAYANGILQLDGQAVPPPEPAISWRVQASGRFTRWLAVLALGGVDVALWLQPITLPENILQLLAGWLLTGVATSLGYLLAACVLRHAGGDIYRPRFAWKTPVPHFHLDLGDVVMTGRNTEIDVALMRLTPQLIFASLAGLHAPGLLLPLLGGVLLQLSPLGPTPMLALLRGLYHDPRLATNYDFIFAQNQMFGVLRYARLQFADRKFLLACAGYTFTWLVLVFLTGCALLQVNALGLIQQFQTAGGFHFTALVLLIAFAAMALFALGTMGWIAFRHVRDWWRERTQSRARPVPAPLALETMLAVLGRTPLFRTLPPEDLAAIAAALQPEEHAAGSYVLREGEPGDRLYVVYSGCVEVVRELAVGKPEPVAELEAGDIFGEAALLTSGRRTRSVRCLEATVLLALRREAFQSLVLTRFSRHAIEDAVQKTGFLRRIALSRHWSPQAMAAFAQRASFQEFAAGALIIQNGADNQFFHLIHEGEFAVLKNKKEIARLGPGEFFGEISLLQNSPATADVVARTPGRCLLVSKQEFLHFMTKDFMIGLQFEGVGTKRLGRPLFPLKGHSIDVIRAD